MVMVVMIQLMSQLIFLVILRVVVIMSTQWTDPNHNIEMVRINSDTFTMGSPDSETDRRSVEGPVHTVNISKDFYIGKYEVTQGQWAQVIGGNNHGQIVVQIQLAA